MCDSVLIQRSKIALTGNGSKATIMQGGKGNVSRTSSMWLYWSVYTETCK